MADGCCVCFDEKGYVGNPLVYCDGPDCNIAVHKACYGIVSVPKGNWYCSKCASDPKPGTVVRCALCPSTEGALKRTDSGGWVHVICALYIPEVAFANVTNMEPIVIKNVPASKFKKECYFCRQRNEFATGACIECHKTDCKFTFHVTCAQKNGLLREEKGTRDMVNYCGYCPEHFPKKNRSINDNTVGARTTTQSEQLSENDDNRYYQTNNSDDKPLSIICNYNNEDNNNDDDDDDGEDVPLRIVEDTNLSLVSNNHSHAPVPSTNDDNEQTVVNDIGSNSGEGSTTAKIDIADRSTVITIDVSSKCDDDKVITTENEASNSSSNNKRNKKQRLNDNNNNRTLNAPHMLGNQLNPTSTMAQQLRDTLAAEVQDHSICDEDDDEETEDGQPNNCSRKSGPSTKLKLFGPQLYSKIVASSLSSSNADSGTSGLNSSSTTVETLEQLLEKRWQPTDSYAQQSSVHFDLASFLNGLRKIHLENKRLEEYVRSMKSQADLVAEENSKLEEAIKTELNSP